MKYIFCLKLYSSENKSTISGFRIILNGVLDKIAFSHHRFLNWNYVSSQKEEIHFVLGLKGNMSFETEVVSFA